MRRFLLKAIAAFLLACSIVVAGVASADTYPSRSIKLVVPFAPGGQTDTLARFLGQRMASVLGQPIVIDNRPGAGSTLGTDLVAKSMPDGYTLCMISTTHVIGTHLYKKLPYHPIDDFVPVARLSDGAMVLAVNSSLKATSVRDLIDLARKQPGRLTYSSSGNGSTGHLLGALFSSAAGITLTHIPYKGSGGSMTDLLGGRVDMTFVGIPQALPHIRSGKLRALAVSSDRRIKELPNVTTMTEAGVPGFVAMPWIGLVAPKGTPPAVVAKLEAAANAAFNSPEAKSVLAAAGVDVAFAGSADFGEQLRADYDKWGKVVVQSGMTVD